MEFKIPASMKAEHEELHRDLEKAGLGVDKVSAAARDVAKVLHPHFEKEEAYALPPLGLLPILAGGKIAADMADVLQMTDRLKAELPSMLEEHKVIVRVLQNLLETAKEENKPEVAAFAERLIAHAKSEEEVSYPASILIGEYVRLKLRK